MRAHNKAQNRAKKANIFEFKLHVCVVNNIGIVRVYSDYGGHGSGLKTGRSRFNIIDLWRNVAFFSMVAKETGAASRPKTGFWLGHYSGFTYVLRCHILVLIFGTVHRWFHGRRGTQINNRARTRGGGSGHLHLVEFVNHPPSVPLNIDFTLE